MGAEAAVGVVVGVEVPPASQEDQRQKQQPVGCPRALRHSVVCAFRAPLGLRPRVKIRSLSAALVRFATRLCALRAPKEQRCCCVASRPEWVKSCGHGQVLYCLAPASVWSLGVRPARQGGGRGKRTVSVRCPSGYVSPA